MPISSTSLFHYTTGGLDAILGIIDQGFRVRANKEINPASFKNDEFETNEINLRKGVLSGGSAFLRYQHIPMVCFCDIKFSSISDHLERYGTPDSNGHKFAYAIGLTKKWGQKNGLNPVQYIVPGSHLATALASAFKPAGVKETTHGHGIRVEDYSPPTPMGDGFMKCDNKGNVFPASYLYSKVIGVIMFNVYNSNGTNGTDYQDEKEWRFVPPNAMIIDEFEWNTTTINITLYESIHCNAERAVNESRYDNLRFESSDIAHIIVAKDKEVVEVHKKLLERFPTLSSEDQILLLSKINSFERLSRDW